MNTLSLLPNKSRPRARVEALAVLPVFIKLHGKRVLIAGGTEAAAWKAELLAACGAQVHIYARELDEEFVALFEGAASAQYTHHASAWTAASFDHAAIAICDADTQENAQLFFDAARQSGVPVNVIDKPEFCEFQFGSIVNRSPAIIAISTDGAAPILGQAIRRKIETLLPLSLAGWAKLAAKLRAPIHERLTTSAERRAFWEHLAKRAFGAGPDSQDEKQMLAEATRLKSGLTTKSGRVTFVGAGPGDAELLTLKAVRALQAADVILFDDAISDQVLELARREAKRLLVGEGNDTLVALAKSGKHVVRLLIGDAVGGAAKINAALALAKAQIAYETVPGIALETTHAIKFRNHG